ncbi:MAG: glycosyl hydrolase family 25 [Bacteroidaceae bacterium]|nr:glycosyl hydrolase family 25 [Bacteroidaceae bacterium]
MKIIFFCFFYLSSLAASANETTTGGSNPASNEVPTETAIHTMESPDRRSKLSPDDDELQPHPDALPTSLAPQRPLSDDPPLTQDEQVHLANTSLQGIDVSHYQGRINWQQVAKSGGISYVYVKATEGERLVDDTYRQNVREARRAGLYVGAYHFYRPNASVQQQLLNLTQTVSLRDMDLIPIIDIEHRGRESLANFQRKLKQFLDQVEKHYGIRPMLYTSRDFYNKYLSGPFTSYKYMIARYHPEVPKLRDDATFVLWQYSATGRMQGIAHHVDRSCFMDNYSLRDILLTK